MRPRKNKVFSLRKLLGIIALVLFFLLLGLYLKRFMKIENIPLIDEKTFDGSVKIAILNGNGYPNVANEVKEYFLRNFSANIDVVGCRNVDSRKFIYKQSLIVLKHNQPEKLDFIMKLTNIPYRIFAFDEEAIEEIQIILGKDYLEYFRK